MSNTMRYGIGGNNFLSRSFSLIELIIVIFIVFIIITFSISRGSLFNSFIVKNELDKLFTTSFFLQQKAISGNSLQRLFFDCKNKTYFYVLNNKKIKHKLANVVKFDFIRSVLGPPSSAMKPIKEPATFKKDKNGFYFITFYPNSKIDSGTIYLVDEAYKFMFAFTSPISQVSFIRKYKYQNHKWVVI